MSSNIAQKIEEIWRAVLTVPAGQEDATFFELGGESISAVRIASRIEEELDIWIDVGDLFEDDPNLATLIRSATAKAEDASAA
ncbi:phosphopantetheine-binding protein [Amycolatopsis sp. lyj-23]|uniref:phosphopantetheine-binding protein n=1 Tax=Amycolatopsis sp. lyj-23 TaxID=2789283 RepID=UPI00397D145A